MQLVGITNNEATIIGRVVGPAKATLAPEAARAILALGFDDADRERMDYLAGRARAGAITADEQAEIEAYSRVGSLLGVFKSKARRSLGVRPGSGTVH